ncbi:hypothetical protein CDCA_CDCA11G3306 [Cyanidium caldarium]|uniref:Histone H1 n=1 Tax=Cyanidium caldarium TaxID=2771 RepID=A0AAV9IYX8_CYACA|nr:hypothetical protein CDCA_CDCA11G3306 [Cyanidium caldarium]
MDTLDELRECVEALGREAGKFFEKGNKAAGVRARQHAQELKRLTQVLREKIQEAKTPPEPRERSQPVVPAFEEPHL